VLVSRGPCAASSIARATPKSARIAWPSWSRAVLHQEDATHPAAAELQLERVVGAEGALEPCLEACGHRARAFTPSRGSWNGAGTAAREPDAGAGHVTAAEGGRAGFASRARFADRGREGRPRPGPAV
jgi:hypothetical protein